MSTSYISALAFALGVAFTPFYQTLILSRKRIISYLRSQIKNILRGFFFLITSLAAILLAVISPYSDFSYYLQAEYVHIDISRYESLVQPENESLDIFDLTEKIKFQYKTNFSYEDESRRSLIAGLLLKSINNNPAVKNYLAGVLPNDDNYRNPSVANEILELLNKNIELELKSKLSTEKAGLSLEVVSFRPLEDFIATIDLPLEVTPLPNVEVIKLPEGAFHRAKGTKEGDVEILPFTRNLTTVRWSAKDLEGDIAFSFFSPPYYRFSFLLKPFAGISSFGSGLLVVFGLFSTLVLTEIVKPILLDELKERAKLFFGKINKNSDSKNCKEGQQLKALAPKDLENKNIVNDQAETSVKMNQEIQLNTQNNSPIGENKNGQEINTES